MGISAVPRPLVAGRVGDREAVVDAVGRDAREPLDDAGVRARGMHQVPHALIALRGQVGRLDDQRLALPVGARVAQPLADPRSQMPAAVQRDDPRVVDHLHQDHDVVGRLQNLIVVVVEAGHHGAGHAARDAPVVEVQVLPGVERRAVAHGRERGVALPHAIRLRGGTSRRADRR